MLFPRPSVADVNGLVRIEAIVSRHQRVAIINLISNSSEAWA